MIVKLTQDKVVKHSVRYGTPADAKVPMSVYVPKMLLLAEPKSPELNGWPQHVWINISTEEIK